MKKIYNLSSGITILFLLVIVSQAPAQTNHTQIYSFMKSIGWTLSPDNNFREPTAIEHNKVHYYNFDTSRKYAIVAFTRNSAIKSYDLEALYDNGNLYTHANNNSQGPKPFQKRFNYPMIIFNPTENMKLGLKVNSVPGEPRHYSQVHYMIFYR
ncbi:MAG: hypothetical protein JWQ96_798 [Segetibacter sp.]|nr:hypothetical protein [Segetibacter sp.]